MRRLRQIHNLLGAFFAPAIIFFAFSGALQTFDLHEGKPGAAYQPPAWVVTIASLHKDQRLPKPKAPEPDVATPPGNHASASQSPGGPESPEPEPAKAPSPLPLKIFVLTLAGGLIGTAVMGVWIALKNRAMRRNTLIMLGLGVAVPIVLLLV